MKVCGARSCSPASAFGKSARASTSSASHPPNNSFKPTPCRGVGCVLCATLARIRRPATGRLNSGVSPVTKFRATFDQSVIDSWAAQLSARKRGFARVFPFLIALAIVFLALAIFLNMPVLLWLFFGTVCLLVIANLHDRGTLLCPHCNQAPLGTFERGPASNADFCPHCFYWLRSPYGSNANTQG